MTASGFDSSRFERNPVLGIIRGITVDSLYGVLDAVVEAGMEFVEITLNTEHATDLIQQASQKYRKTLCIGAGTVLSVDDAERAYEAGAQFLVSPTLNSPVSALCRWKKIPYFPGAFSPSEIEAAWIAGACRVKVFPSSVLGPRYFKEISGPFPDIRTMAVGGVRADNVAEFMDSGASAVAIGGSVFSVQRMRDGEFSQIQNDVKDILIAVRDNLK